MQGFPYQDPGAGVTAVGIAAAAKLEFEIAPANQFAAVYYRLLSFWNKYQPWTTVVFAAIAFIVLLKLFNKIFQLDISLQKKSSQKKSSKKKSNDSQQDLK